MSPFRSIWSIFGDLIKIYIFIYIHNVLVANVLKKLIVIHTAQLQADRTEIYAIQLAMLACEYRQNCNHR